jgi:hypothetical protein
LTNNLKDCTHLIANTMIKSIKFLSCLNRGVHIVNELWLHESYRAKMFMSKWSKQTKMLVITIPFGVVEYDYFFRAGLNKPKEALSFEKKKKILNV